MTQPGEVIPAQGQGQGHLLETSVLTRLHVLEVRRRVTQLPPERLARCDLSDLELGHSARSGAEWLQIQGALAGLGRQSVGPGHLSRALEVQHELAARGQRGRKVPDLVIAAVAERAGLVVIHYDGDFELIAAVTGQPHEWVVPRGSID